MPIEVAPEIRAALDAGRPVVALETTLVSHGLPWPHNLETALKMADAVRSEDAVPAVIGVLDGRLRVGLTQGEIARFAKEPGIAKCSTRDLPLAMAGGGNGATTVSATVEIAARVGIRWMATGGIGGVHRGIERSGDVSADLDAIRRSKVVVVCSGAKIILDLPRTVEWLETLGVPLLGWQTGQLPGFYTAETGLEVPEIADCRALQRWLAAWEELGFQSGVVLAAAPPAHLAMGGAEVAQLVAAALDEVPEAERSGKAATPALLAAMARLSMGRTVELNRELIVANAGLAARCARQCAKLREAA
ncbi:pseudouridine-5'-phosphate glycosidase [Geminicoccus roseus]|uniref:pseudouridine-5'-phosphate glycosidase n=1 Tax=Geminicoccus roseus TaxID=404900 RepID=UPI000400EB98|nr:pseudouridine-5'-phosphate glycosidase [Geminicoccus roseus]